MSDTTPAGSTRARRPAAPPAVVALLAGAVVALSLPPWGFWPLSFVGVVLFDLALGPSPSRRRAAGLAFLFALAWPALRRAWVGFGGAVGGRVGGRHGDTGGFTPEWCKGRSRRSSQRFRGISQGITQTWWVHGQRWTRGFGSGDDLRRRGPLHEAGSRRGKTWRRQPCGNLPP